jgi:hypothetical protein
MKNKTRDLILIGILLAGTLSACNFPLFREAGEPTPTPLSDIDLLGTAVAQTMSVLQSELQEQAATPIPTATVLPTATSAADLTSQQYYSQSTTYSVQACYAASITSQSIADDTEMDQDEEFTQTWKVVNAGTCNWPSDTELVYVDGTQMDGDSSEDIDTVVSPGETLSTSVALTAPSTDGTYTGEWALITPDGTTIVNLWVIIVVGDGDSSDDFTVSTVSFSSAETYTGVCPYTYTYKAYITTEGEGEVVYNFKYSDGSVSSSKTLDFDEDETQTVSGSWTLSSSGSYWVKVYISDPNNQTFGSAKLTLVCSSPTKTPTTAPTTAPTAVPTTEPTEAPTEEISTEDAGSAQTST